MSYLSTYLIYSWLVTSEEKEINSFSDFLEKEKTIFPIKQNTDKPKESREQERFKVILKLWKAWKRKGDKQPEWAAWNSNQWEKKFYPEPPSKNRLRRDLNDLDGLLKKYLAIQGLEIYPVAGEYLLAKMVNKHAEGKSVLERMKKDLDKKNQSGKEPDAGRELPWLRYQVARELHKREMIEDNHEAHQYNRLSLEALDAYYLLEKMSLVTGAFFNGDIILQDGKPKDRDLQWALEQETEPMGAAYFYQQALFFSCEDKRAHPLAKVEEQFRNTIKGAGKKGNKKGRVPTLDLSTYHKRQLAGLLTGFAKRQLKSSIPKSYEDYHPLIENYRFYLEGGLFTVAGGYLHQGYLHPYHVNSFYDLYFDAIHWIQDEKKRKTEVATFSQLTHKFNSQLDPKFLSFADAYAGLLNAILEGNQEKYKTSFRFFFSQGEYPKDVFLNAGIRILEIQGQLALQKEQDLEVGYLKRLLDNLRKYINLHKSFDEKEKGNHKKQGRISEERAARFLSFVKYCNRLIQKKEAYLLGKSWYQAATIEREALLAEPYFPQKGWLLRQYDELIAAFPDR